MQIELCFDGISDLRLQGFSTEPRVDLTVLRDRPDVRFRAESDSIQLSGRAKSVTVLRISPYADGAREADG